MVARTHPCARAVRITCEGQVEIRKCRVELVPILLDPRTQHDRGGWRIRVRPPGLQCCACIADVPWILGLLAECEIALGERQGRRGITRSARRTGAQLPQLARGCIQNHRQPLQDDVVLLRPVRYRQSGRWAEQRDRQNDGEAQQTACRSFEWHSRSLAGPQGGRAADGPALVRLPRCQLIGHFPPAQPGSPGSTCRLFRPSSAGAT